MGKHQIKTHKYPRNFHVVEIWLKPSQTQGTIVLVYPASPISMSLLKLLRLQEERRLRRRQK